MWLTSGQQTTQKRKEEEGHGKLLRGGRCQVCECSCSDGIGIAHPPDSSQTERCRTSSVQTPIGWSWVDDGYRKVNVGQVVMIFSHTPPDLNDGGR
jgi:hypothetical protein